MLIVQYGESCKLWYCVCKREVLETSGGSYNRLNRSHFCLVGKRFVLCTILQPFFSLQSLHSVEVFH